MSKIPTTPVPPCSRPIRANPKSLREKHLSWVRDEAASQKARGLLSELGDVDAFITWEMEYYDAQA